MAPEPTSQPWKIHRGVSRKLALSVGAVAVVVGLGLLFILLPFERHAISKAASNQVALLADGMIASFVETDHDSGQHHGGVIDQVGGFDNVIVAELLDAQGIVVRSSDNASIGVHRGLSKGLREVRLDDELVHVTTNMPWTRSCIACHEAEQDPVGALHLSVSRAQSLRSVETFHLASGIGILLGFLLLTGVLVFLTDRIVSRPIFRLAHVMRRAAQGDFLVRARHTSDDELGALVRVFNSMLKSITSLKANEIEREADLKQVREELTLKDRLEETNQALERRVRAQGLLMEAVHRLSSTLDHEAILDRLQQIVHDTFEVKDAAIFLMAENEAGEAVLRPSRTNGAAVDVLVEDIAIGVGITGWVAETGAPYRVSDVASTDGRFGAERDVLQTGTTLAVPMLHKGRVLGVMLYFSKDRDGFDDDDVELLQALASQAAMAVVNAELHQKTVELSVTDPLTGLMNRRALESRLDLELIRARRFSMPLTVMMIDVDHFKAYNDRMGHLLGDDALIRIARVLRENVRKVDGVARFGGEEFAIFLPRTDVTAALDVAEKLRAAVQAVDVRGGRSQPMGFLSVSIGLAVFPDDMPPAVEKSPSSTLMEIADRALYEAKDAGRNRVLAASPLKGTEASNRSTQQTSSGPAAAAPVAE